jgi:hypothetical protein
LEHQDQDHYQLLHTTAYKYCLRPLLARKTFGGFVTQFFCLNAFQSIQAAQEQEQGEGSCSK